MKLALIEKPGKYSAARKQHYTGAEALQSPQSAKDDWVAVKELNLSYYIGETQLFTIYTHYGNLI